MDMMETMRTLENASGQQFDQEFITAMIAHHQSGIEMAKMAQEKAVSEELREIASEIANKQENEIQQMKEMQKEIAF